MQTKKILLIIGVAAIIIYGCKPSKQEKINEIKSLEDKMKTSDIRKDKELVGSYIVACEDYCRRFPEDSLSPKYLFELAVVSMTIGNTQDAIRFFDEVYRKYPDSKKAPDALLQKAIIYDVQLNDFKNAERLYYKFIGKYPNNINVQVARDAISVLGKNPEEIINNFKSNNNSEK